MASVLLLVTVALIIGVGFLLATRDWKPLYRTRWSKVRAGVRPNPVRLMIERSDWLDERCYVKPKNRTALYKKSEDWFCDVTPQGLVYYIKDERIAFEFKMRWG